MPHSTRAILCCLTWPQQFRWFRRYFAISFIGLVVYLLCRSRCALRHPRGTGTAGMMRGLSEALAAIPCHRRVRFYHCRCCDTAVLCAIVAAHRKRHSCSTVLGRLACAPDGVVRVAVATAQARAATARCHSSQHAEPPTAHCSTTHGGGSSAVTPTSRWRWPCAPQMT